MPIDLLLTLFEIHIITLTIFHLFSFYLLFSLINSVPIYPLYILSLSLYHITSNMLISVHEKLLLQLFVVPGSIISTIDPTRYHLTTPGSRETIPCEIPRLRTYASGRDLDPKPLDSVLLEPYDYLY